MAEPLVRGQRVFAAHVAAQTGLDPRVVGAWLKSEQSGSAAQAYEKRGYNDWLNIANTDSGPASGANSSAWKNPVTAAKATAEWIRGQGQIAKEYGKPAAGISAILKTAGKNPQAQINAIGSSGWATAPDYGQKIGALFNELKGDQGLVHEAQRATDPSTFDNHTAVAAGALASMGMGGPQAALEGQAAQQQSSDLTQLLQSLATPAQKESSVAGDQLVRPPGSGGPAQQAGAPRTPAPLSAPTQAPEGERQDAILALVQKLGADSSERGAQPSEGIATPAPKAAAAAPNVPIAKGVVANSKGAAGFTPAATANYGKGVLPELTQRLNAVGAHLGIKLTGISGYRSPQHSVEVGGFADDPHTKGLASDTEGAQTIPKAVLNRFGLERPFAGSKEANHIQLLHSVNKNGGY